MIEYSIDVFCDGAPGNWNCHERFEVTGLDQIPTAAAHYGPASRKQWICEGNKQFCPDCWAKRVKHALESAHDLGVAHDPATSRPWEPERGPS